MAELKSQAKKLYTPTEVTDSRAKYIAIQGFATAAVFFYMEM